MKTAALIGSMLSSAAIGEFSRRPELLHGAIVRGREN